MPSFLIFRVGSHITEHFVLAPIPFSAASFASIIVMRVTCLIGKTFVRGSPLRLSLRYVLNVAIWAGVV